jgi:hypothetical protein
MTYRKWRDLPTSIDFSKMVSTPKWIKFSFTVIVLILNSTNSLINFNSIYVACIESSIKKDFHVSWLKNRQNFIPIDKWPLSEAEKHVFYIGQVKKWQIESIRGRPFFEFTTRRLPFWNLSAPRGWLNPNFTNAEFMKKKTGGILNMGPIRKIYEQQILISWGNRPNRSYQNRNIDDNKQQQKVTHHINICHSLTAGCRIFVPAINQGSRAQPNQEENKSNSHIWKQRTFLGNLTKIVLTNSIIHIF